MNDDDIDYEANADFWEEQEALEREFDNAREAEANAFNDGYEQGRADRNIELANLIDNADMDSNYLYICISRDNLENMPHMKYQWEIIDWVKKQIKEHKNE